MNQNENANVIKLPKHGPVSFVTVLFIFVALYLAVHGILLLSQSSIKVYNVGVPTDDNVAALHTGIVLRNEVPVKSTADGYLSYFTVSGEWMSENSLICSVDQNGNIEEKLRTLYYGHSSLSQSAKTKIQTAIRSAVENYDPLDFETAIRAKGDVEAVVLNALLGDGSDLDTKLEGIAYVPVYAKESGFFMTWIDGMEGTTAEMLRSDDFTAEKYQRTPIRGGKHVSEGDVLYKYAPDNKFVLAFLISDAEIASYGTRKSISVRMSDGLEITGSFSISKTEDGKNLGLISFAKYGGNYLTERYQEFRILDKSVSGFKIPESAVVTKTFFVVPERFITAGGGGTQNGVMLDENGKGRFVACTVYTRDNSDEKNNFIIGEGVAYVTAAELSAGCKIIAPGDSREEMVLAVTAAVEGCFQVNNGYCIFKPIVRIQNSIDTSYLIVSSHVRGGLRSYDRIVLDAAGMSENEIIFN